MASAKTWGGILRIIAIVLAPIMKAVTPMIVDALEDGLVKLLDKARATDNPIDDLFVEFIFRILGLPIPEEV